MTGAVTVDAVSVRGIVIVWCRLRLTCRNALGVAEDGEAVHDDVGHGGAVVPDLDAIPRAAVLQDRRMLSGIGLISDVATALGARVRNSEGAVVPVHYAHGVAGFVEVGRFLDGEEGRSARGSAVRIASGLAHVVGGGERRWHVAKQGSKRKDRHDAADCP